MKVKDLYWEETNSITLNDPILPEQPLRCTPRLTDSGLRITIGIKNHGTLTINDELAARISTAIERQQAWKEYTPQGTITITPNKYGNTITINTGKDAANVRLNTDQSTRLAQWLQNAANHDYRPPQRVHATTGGDHGKEHAMSVFDPESTRNGFEAGFELTDRPGDPYRFHLSFDLNPNDVIVKQDENGRWFIEIDGMSMGDMLGLNRHLARQISDAKRARKERDAR